MDTVQVFPNESGTITIMQDGPHLCATSYVIVRPEQVETLVRWLREVKAEMQPGTPIAKDDVLLTGP
jgi:hypothetical protein